MSEAILTDVRLVPVYTEGITDYTVEDSVGVGNFSLIVYSSEFQNATVGVFAVVYHFNIPVQYHVVIYIDKIKNEVVNFIPLDMKNAVVSVVITEFRNYFTGLESNWIVMRLLGRQNVLAVNSLRVDMLEQRQLAKSLQHHPEYQFSLNVMAKLMQAQRDDTLYWQELTPDDKTPDGLIEEIPEVPDVFVNYLTKDEEDDDPNN